MGWLTMFIFIMSFVFSIGAEYTFIDYCEHAEFSIKRVAIRALMFIVVMAVFVKII